jgi:hypothetical protein
MQCDVTTGGRNRSRDLLPGFFLGGIGRCLLIVASLLPNAFLPWAAAVVPAIAWPEAAVAQDDAGDAPADEAAEPEGENLLVFYAKALGLKYIVVFLLLSFGLVALLVMCFMQIRRVVLMPPGLSQAFEAHLESKEYQQAYELAKTDDSYLGHVLAAGMGKLQSGYTASVEAMQEEEGEQGALFSQQVGATQEGAMQQQGGRLLCRHCGAQQQASGSEGGSGRARQQRGRQRGPQRAASSRLRRRAAEGATPSRRGRAH